MRFGTTFVTVSYTFEGVTKTVDIAITVAKIDYDMSGITFAGGSAAGTAGARYHTVVQGDTLWAIAARNGTTVRALCALTPQIANPNRIYPGERVRLS